MNTLRAFVTLLLTASAVRAEDWPQWLGPRRDGGSKEIVAVWTTAPKPAWKQPVGEGHSSPIVAGGKVYSFSRVRDKSEEMLQAFDAATGKPLWQQTYDRGSFNSLFGNGPRGTPCRRRRQDLHVRRHRHPDLLRCRQRRQGLASRYAQAVQGPEPVLRRLLLAAGRGQRGDGQRRRQGASIVAFDKDAGKEVWKQLDDKASYSSPIAIGQGDSRSIVFLTAKRLVALAPDGRQRDLAVSSRRCAERKLDDAGHQRRRLVWQLDHLRRPRPQARSP